MSRRTRRGMKRTELLATGSAILEMSGLPAKLVAVLGVRGRTAWVTENGQASEGNWVPVGRLKPV